MAKSTLDNPADFTVLSVDKQAGLASGAGFTGRQSLSSNAVELARTSGGFADPTVVSTWAFKVYSGPLIPPPRVCVGSDRVTMEC
jgi:hypothetical protein